MFQINFKSKFPLIGVMILIACQHQTTEPNPIEPNPIVEEEVSLKTSQSLIEKKPERKIPISRMTSEELDLKLAKLWNRVDELETRLVRQQEKTRLLEKGFMLGLLPEKMTDDFEKDDKRDQSESSMEDQGSSSPQLKEKLVSKARVTQENVQASSKNYQDLLVEAQSYFNSGKYGQAITSYQKIHENFPNQTDQGQHLYWIGLSWYYLKEDELASESFQKLLEKHEASAWVPKANFYLAKIDLRRGLRQKALERLAKIVENFPEQEVAEMARFELGHLQESL